MTADGLHVIGTPKDPQSTGPKVVTMLRTADQSVDDDAVEQGQLQPPVHSSSTPETATRTTLLEEIYSFLSNKSVLKSLRAKHQASRRRKSKGVDHLEAADSCYWMTLESFREMRRIARRYTRRNELGLLLRCLRAGMLPAAEKRPGLENYFRVLRQRLGEATFNDLAGELCSPTFRDADDKNDPTRLKRLAARVAGQITHVSVDDIERRVAGQFVSVTNSEDGRRDRSGIRVYTIEPRERRPALRVRPAESS
jgi:hypothetical protein